MLVFWVENLIPLGGLLPIKLKTNTKRLASPFGPPVSLVIIPTLMMRGSSSDLSPNRHNNPLQTRVRMFGQGVSDEW